MLQPLTNRVVGDRHLADHPVAHGSSDQSTSFLVRKPRPSARPTARPSALPATLVVLSRSHSLRFRIVTAPSAPLPTDVPVSLPYSGHRMCRKAMDCNGDETSHRYQW
jgi:hypothetical protein